MNIPYIRLYHNCIQISGLAAKQLESIVSFYESERILLIMNDPNGIYPLHRGMKVNTVAVHSQNLARYLLDKFGKSGCFCAEYRPITGMTDTSLVISEEPLDDVSLNIKDFTPIDFIPLSRHTCITLTKTSININNMGKLPYYGPIDILKRDDVFALVPNPNNFIKLIRNKDKNNDGVIFSSTLNTVLAETSSCFHWLWEENGILYFTANPKSRRRFLSTEGFIPISSRRERLLCQSTLSIHTCTNSLSVAWQDTESMKEHEYFSLFESGKFMALVPDPNGDYQRHYSHEPRGYHFYGKALCQYLLEKFQGATMFHLRVVQNRFVFSPEYFKTIPKWNTFRKIPSLKTVCRIHFYRTAERRNLALPCCITKYLPGHSPISIAFYRHKQIWAIVSEKNGPYRLQKKKGVVYCADIIPQIQENLQCEDEDFFRTKFDHGVLLFSNRRLENETFDPKKFKRVE